MHSESPVSQKCKLRGEKIVVSVEVIHVYFLKCSNQIIKFRIVLNHLKICGQSDIYTAILILNRGTILGMYYCYNSNYYMLSQLTHTNVCTHMYIYACVETFFSKITFTLSENILLFFYLIFHI